MERGNHMQRWADFWVGIPLIAFAGCGKRLRRLVAPPRIVAENVRRVGIVGLGAIGDILLATALFSGLKDIMPHASFEVITSKSNAAAHGLFPPEITVTSYSVKDIHGIVKHIRAARYDLLFDLGQWPRISALMCAVSGARCTVGFATRGQHRHFAYDVAVRHKNDRHEVENFLALGRAIFPELAGVPGIHIPESPSPGCPVLPEKRVVFCHMWPSGVRSHLKEWPCEHWKKLALALLDAGYTPVFTGGPQDARPTQAFFDDSGLGETQEGGRAISVAGRISLPDLTFHMARASAVISVNTGIMHLAAIVGAPTIGLHGPTNPLRWGPRGKRCISLLPRSGHSAYLNLGFEYPDGAVAVLHHLPVDDVLAALREFELAL